jgi:hypothetical protein
MILNRIVGSFADAASSWCSHNATRSTTVAWVSIAGSSSVRSPGFTNSDVSVSDMKGVMIST